jgi:ABC-type transport system involved in multi-copper enzyme maturation permease subunit
MNGVRAIARLQIKRVLRGRMIWAVAILITLPLVIALLARYDAPGVEGRWKVVCYMTYRSLVLLAPVLLLATAVSEESDGKTYTYLWSRPVRREALLFGKLLALAPIAMAAACVGLAGAYGITAAGGAIEGLPLPRVLLGAAAGVLGASCNALGIGALFPRHPLVAAMAFVFFAEQILPEMPAIQNVTTLHHAFRRIAVDGEVAGGLAALAILSAVWLGVAVWRVRRLELGSAEG